MGLVLSTFNGAAVGLLLRMAGMSPSEVSWWVWLIICISPCNIAVSMAFHYRRQLQ